MTTGGGGGGVTVTDAVADLVGSAVLVAVTVAEVLAVTVGAVYRPVPDIFPGEADQVTATLDVLVTNAVNCSVPPEATVAVAGVTVTATGAITVRVKDLEEVCFGEEESVTSTVILNWPVCDVVPESHPADCTAIPVGSEPEESVQVKGAVPPVAVRGFEYAVPAVAFDKDVVVMTTGGGVTVTDAVADLVGSAMLVAVTVAVVLAVTVGA